MLLFIPSAMAALFSCSKQKKGISLAFYNCENFFDTVNNPAKDDDEFTPGGTYRYTRTIYRKKLHNTAMVLASIDVPDGPALTGLSEVENISILNDLLHTPELKRRGYGAICATQGDARGMNVALLYKKKSFRPLTHKEWTIPPVDKATRSILEVCGLLGQDTTYIFINHWPSRRGGAAAVLARRVAARTLSERLKELYGNGRQHIIVMGDFNDNPEDSSMTQELQGLNNPFMQLRKAGQGTEYFGSTLNLFDQILLSPSYAYDSAAIFSPDFIKNHRRGHTNEPARSFRGKEFANGYSDHFPVVVWLKHK